MSKIKCNLAFEKWCKTETYLIPLRKNKKPSYRFAMTKYFNKCFKAGYEAAMREKNKK